jgi:NTE family protein
LKDAEIYADGAHLPYSSRDGGVSDNLGMRGVLIYWNCSKPCTMGSSALDHGRGIVILVVNSLSSPPTNWDESEVPPGTIDILLKATGVPIDHYSYEAVEQLKDIAARWNEAREVRRLAGCDAGRNADVCAVVHPPAAEIFPIDVSFAQLADAKERAYLNEQPTSFVLPPEAVDRLRAAAGTIILADPEFQRLLKDLGATIVPAPPASAGNAAGAPK